MNFFLEQYQFNSKIIIENIADKYHLDKKCLKKFYPKQLTKEQRELIKKLKQKKVKSSCQLQCKFFKDCDNNYYVINHNNIFYLENYTGIKL